MVTAPSGSVLDRGETVSQTIPETAPLAAPPAPVAKRSGPSRVLAAVATFAVILVAVILGLVVASWSQPSPEISTVRMSQPAWLQYRSGEDVSAPVVLVPAGVTQAAWNQYRAGERDNHAVVHPVTGTALDAWQQYRGSERLPR